MNFNEKIEQKQICILGLGHVGLTLALVMADRGFNVIGFDTNSQIISDVKQKKSPILEPNIESYLERLIDKTFHATTDLDDITADVYIITVGTPIDSKTKIPNIEYIKSASKTIGEKIKKGDLVILRSTVPIGLSRNIVVPILEEKSGLECGSDFLLSYSPERTIEGEALKELRELPQIVSGYNSNSSIMSSKIFSKITDHVIDVGPLESAEMVKIMNNTFRDVKFAYANEMALICKDLGLDMVELVKSANAGYKRDRIPVPSPGVGGACLSKDSYILRYSTENIEHKPNIVSLARDLNELIPREILKSISQELDKANKQIETSKFFIIGFAFKGDPETADLRGSTTIDFLNELKKSSGEENILYGYDPIVAPEEIEELGIKFVDYSEGFNNADVILFMNNHKSYVSLDIEEMLDGASADCIFFDGWHLFEPSLINSIKQIKYHGVGCKF